MVRREGPIAARAFDPAVLTRISYPSNSLKLTQPAPGRPRELIANSAGTFAIELQYELQVVKKDRESSFNLPVPYGLVNRLKLTVINSDVDVVSPQAVSVQRELSGSNTVASLVLSPASGVAITWRPRSRDVKREKPVFYAEISQLYAPAAGVIEGAHFVAVRPAQGELDELIFDVPKGATVTDVLDASKSARNAEGKTEPGSIVSLWRFDPDTRKLRVTLNPAQSRPFGLLVRSQLASGPLPLEQSVGLLAVEGAAGQIGLLGIATGNEVQLDTFDGEKFSPINLEDFPGETLAALQSQIPGLTLRRAYRYSETQAAATLRASAVEPDVRVEAQDTLSLGEDRSILAGNAAVNISRAGIFRLSFTLPAGFDVESISGSALSHWTELKTGGDRVITLHLTGKTEGQQQFAVSLAGPGIKATNNWTVPKIVFREAGKQRGTLLIVPEQGMRLTATNSDGLTQLDPQKSGIRQKGVLAFRVLQTPWNLALNLEQVEPWIQVTSLQHATINDAQIKVAANLQYQIENMGLKLFACSCQRMPKACVFMARTWLTFCRWPAAKRTACANGRSSCTGALLGLTFSSSAIKRSCPSNRRRPFFAGCKAPRSIRSGGLSRFVRVADCRSPRTMFPKRCNPRNGKASRARFSRTCRLRRRISRIDWSNPAFNCRCASNGTSPRNCFRLA